MVFRDQFSSPEPDLRDQRHYPTEEKWPLICSRFEEHDLLILRLPSAGIGIEPETPERVVQQRAPDLDLRLAATHPVVERDDLRLRLREVGVGPDLQRDL